MSGIDVSSVRRSAALIAAAGVCACGGGGGGGGETGGGPPGTGTPPPPGLSERPSNTSCVAPERPAGGAGTLAVVDAYPALPAFDQPVALLREPGDAGRWYVVEKPGVVRFFENATSADVAPVFVDISARVDDSAGEEGLLGMAFHPDYAANGEVYLSYTGGNGQSRISRFSRMNADALDPASETVLLTLDQPFGNHNGGNVAFGPDGYLYIGFGDGGSGGDPGDRAQDTANLFGAMLRIGVDGAAPYEIPPDNPFAPNARCETGEGSAACPEIYAWGFRNPWRWSFDRDTGELWVADVGQNAWEEVSIVELGGNYGWRCREGAHPFDGSGVCPAGLIDPVIEYDHSVGSSITGGYVYRGAAVALLGGRYVFGDFSTGRLFASTVDANGDYGFEILTDTGFNIASFGEAADGELFFVDFGGGRVQRIDAGTGSSAGGPAARLSETGCLEAADPALPAAGLVPYEPIAGFWSDGAAKERWFAIPDGSTIDVAADGDYAFPPGTVLVKHFRLAGELVETRLFMRHPDGAWAGYSYEWDAAGNDAALVTGGKRRSVGGQEWIYPSGADCLQCHTAAAGRSLGLEVAQLNSELTYPSTGTRANQLVTHEGVGLLSAPLGAEPADLPALVDPADAGGGLAARARAYLHTNCAGCHRPGGPTPSGMDLRHDTGLGDTGACDAPPASGDLGIAGARLIAPGDAARSLIVARMDRRDASAMPPLASAVVDVDGVALVSEWIEGLAGCL